MDDRTEGLLGSRYLKLDRLRKEGIDPYPARCSPSQGIRDVVALFEAMEDDLGDHASDVHVTVSGRIISLRGMGRASFLDLRDGSGTIQVLLRENVLEQAYGLLENLDLGDFLEVIGPVMRTRTGQVTIEAHDMTLLSKCMRPLPEKWHGLRDVEIRYRQRYLDLIANPEIANSFAQRSQIIKSIRRFFDDKGFMEVETPILVPVAAGAHARPFVTHHNALDQQLYLRIATELYLKRLIVGGFDKVYEIGRVFRNEGIDQDHNPEFSLLESYEAYADYTQVMEMVENLFSDVALEIQGTTEIRYGDQVIDFKPPWPRLSLSEELYRSSGIDIDELLDEESLIKKVASMGLDVAERESRGRLIDKLVSTFVEPKLIQPTFLLDYPEEMSPLAKAKQGRPGYVERFEAFAAGMEVANSYSELNDPEVQRDRFASQDEVRLLHQDEEIDRRDDDFLLAMEYGMPPTGGLGIGIDRMVMLLTSQPSIRDVLLFPQMRTSRDVDYQDEVDVEG